MTSLRRFIALLPCLLCLCGPATAHSGGTNAEGCHTNRSTGDYHCHGRKTGVKQKTAPPPVSRLQGSRPAATSDTTHYANCTEARNAGAAPVRRGDPGYALHLDRDGDGVGCE